MLYVSPLKALAVDVERNLRSPLTGIRHTADRLGQQVPEVTVGVRSGDTPAADRRRLVTQPPDILITTPESLFLMLTSQARESLRGVETVIVDEVHAVAGTKRGAHLAVTLERLDALLDKPAQRIGLCATVRPLEEVARFLGGAAPVEIVAPPSTKEWDLQVVVPVEDMTAARGVRRGHRRADAGAVDLAARRGARRRPDRAAQSTIVFANSRRLAERLTARLNEIATERATGERPEPHEMPGRRSSPSPGRAEGIEAVIAKAHHGSVSKEQRALIEDDLKRGRLPAWSRPAASSSASTWARSTWSSRSRARRASPAPCSASAGPATRSARCAAGCCSPSTAATWPRPRSRSQRMRIGAIESLSVPANPLDVLAQQVVAATAIDGWHGRRPLRPGRSAPRAFAQLPRVGVRRDARPALRPLPQRRVRRAAPPHRLGPRDRHAHRPAGRPAARRHQRRHHPRPRAVRRLPRRRRRAPASGWASSTRRWSTSPGSATCSRSAPPAGGSRTSPTTASSSPRRPGVPGRLPFWKGDALGRPAELGAAIGAFTRELAAMPSDQAEQRARPRGLDDCAAGNLVGYLHEQLEATQVLPSDQTLLVERFRDELGDWRLVVHSPYGTPVHAPWALAINARLRERYGIDGQAMATDDGIVIRIPDTDAEAARRRGDRVRARRDRGDRHPGGRRFGAVRLPVPRVRGAGAAAPPPRPRPAQPAVAAAPALGGAARGRQPLPVVPDRPRGGPRVPPGRLRPARPGRR